VFHYYALELAARWRHSYCSTAQHHQIHGEGESESNVISSKVKCTLRGRDLLLVNVYDWYSKFLKAQKIQEADVIGQVRDRCVRDSEGMIHVEFLERGVTINAHYYRTCFAMMCIKRFGRNYLEIFKENHPAA
jgi:hypothetical protein